MNKTDAEHAKETLRVTFVIQGSNLDFDGITRALKTSPSYTHRAGDISKTKTAFADDMWSLTSPLKPKDEPFDAHLKWLAEQLEPSRDFIESLKSAADIYVRCGYVTENEQSGFTLSPAALSFLVKLGISMDVSILSI